MTDIRRHDFVVTKSVIDFGIQGYIREGEMGVVVDTTAPDYCLVNFMNNQMEWIDAKYLKKV